MMPILQCENLTKTYGNRVVLPGVSLELRRGEVAALLGASGCGKSTLLDILAGFTRPDAGEVRLEGRPCTKPGPERGVVFQDAALFPWLSAGDNIVLGVAANGCPREQAVRRAGDWLDRVGLTDCAARPPTKLSGGQRQRVALARALALEPRVLLMDEPFAALDAITGEQMQALFASLQSRLNMAALLVTHDMTEACLLADVVHIMGTGRGLVHSLLIEEPRPRNMTDAAFTVNLLRLRRFLGEVGDGETAAR